MTSFRGLLIAKQDGQQSARVQTLQRADLPEGEVTVRVAWSTLNYKDALAITGRSPVVRKFPMCRASTLRARWNRPPTPRLCPAIRSCSTAGAWARRTGAVWPKWRVCPPRF